MQELYLETCVSSKKQRKIYQIIDDKLVEIDQNSKSLRDYIETVFEESQQSPEHGYDSSRSKQILS